MGGKLALLPALLALAACSSSLSTVPPDFPSPSPTGYAKAVLASSPILYWLMDSQDTLTDISGHHHAGVISGGTQLQSGAISRSDNPALYLYPSTAVTSPAGAGLGPNTTLEFWVRLPQGGSIHLARSASSQADSFRSLDVFTGANSAISVTEIAGVGEQHSLVSSVPLAANSWYYLVLTDDGKSLALWQDGAQTATTTSSNAPLPPGSFSVGGGGAIPVIFDEVAVYPSVLTPDVITAHWHLGCGC